MQMSGCRLLSNHCSGKHPNGLGKNYHERPTHPTLQTALYCCIAQGWEKTFLEPSRELICTLVPRFCWMGSPKSGMQTFEYPRTYNRCSGNLPNAEQTPSEEPRGLYR